MHPVHLHVPNKDYPAAANLLYDLLVDFLNRLDELAMLRDRVASDEGELLVVRAALRVQQAGLS